MQTFQLFGATIHLNNDIQQTVMRDKYSPLYLAEIMVLRVIHGSDAAVHSLVNVGSVDVDPAVVRKFLTETYSKRVVDSLFPLSMPLPLSDPTAPTQEELDAAAKAANEAASKVRADQSKRKTHPALPAGAVIGGAADIPDLTIG